MVVSVYRGQIFTVPLMVADNCCFPSVDIIEASVKIGSSGESPLQFKHDTIRKASKYCHNYSYTLTGGLGIKTAATVEFSIQQQETSPVILTVNLNDCPIGYKANAKSGECSCQDNILKQYKIECYPNNLYTSQDLDG